VKHSHHNIVSLLTTQPLLFLHHWRNFWHRKFNSQDGKSLINATLWQTNSMRYCCSMPAQSLQTVFKTVLPP